MRVLLVRDLPLLFAPDRGGRRHHREDAVHHVGGADVVRHGIEAQSAAVPGVERVTSVSREGVSLVTLRFAWGTDMDFAMLNVRERLDNIRDVAQLETANMNNNIAFNVKVVPGGEDSHQQTVDHIYSYAKAYCDLGGMQMQLNVVSSDTLRDAMDHPENYQNLLVRISGYNAYFVTLNKDMQMELIERAEFGI